MTMSNDCKTKTKKRKVKPTGKESRALADIRDAEKRGTIAQRIAALVKRDRSTNYYDF